MIVLNASTSSQTRAKQHAVAVAISHGYIGARAGFAVTPGIAAYGKVGYTALDTKAFTSAGSLDELDENASGLRFGGGLQVQLPGALEGRLEYRRSRYDDIGGDIGDATTDQVVAGLGLRF